MNATHGRKSFFFFKTEPIKIAMARISFVIHIGGSLEDAGCVKSRFAISPETNYRGWTWIKDVNLNDVAAAVISARSRRWHYRRPRSLFPALLSFRLSSLRARETHKSAPSRSSEAISSSLSRAPLEQASFFRPICIRNCVSAKRARELKSSFRRINHYKYTSENFIVITVWNRI